MNNYDDMNQKSNMIIYTTEDGLTKIETTFDEDTVWLSIDQMAELFQRDKSTISRHIKNVFSEGELQRESVVANFATTEIWSKESHIVFFIKGSFNQQYIVDNKKYKINKKSS